MTKPSRSRRVWAVVPAAGHSRRMGRPKLLLDAGGRPVIARVVDALLSGGVDGVHVVVRSDDLPLQAELELLPVAQLVIVPATSDMRASVTILLHQIVDHCDPQPNDAWLLCPADHPVLSSEVVGQLLAAARRRPDAIHLPTCHGRRGHPTLFPWALASAVAQIPEQQGLNWLIRHTTAPVVEVAVDDESILQDLDTPADYARLQIQWSQQSPG